MSDLHPGTLHRRRRYRLSTGSTAMHILLLFVVAVVAYHAGANSNHFSFGASAAGGGFPLQYSSTGLPRVLPYIDGGGHSAVIKETAARDSRGGDFRKTAVADRFVGDGSRSTIEDSKSSEGTTVSTNSTTLLQQAAAAAAVVQLPPKDTLIIYVFSNTDPGGRRNFPDPRGCWTPPPFPPQGRRTAGGVGGCRCCTRASAVASQGLQHQPMPSKHMLDEAH